MSMGFEIKTTDDANAEYRLIIYKDDIDSAGYKMAKKDLYDLYSQLRSIFKNEGV